MAGLIGQNEATTTADCVSRTEYERCCGEKIFALGLLAFNMHFQLFLPK